MAYFFTSESVSEGHPDKVADQISDALLDEFISRDPDAKVACETLVTTGLVVVSGEVRTTQYVEIQDIVRKTIADIGYTNADYQFEAKSCGVLSTIHAQSDDIFQGVDRQNPEDQGAGDQGMMFGYACNEQDNFMPYPIELAHDLLFELAHIRKNFPNLMPYLRPDAKSQVTMIYDDNNQPIRIDTIVISTQHDEFEDANDPQRNTREKAEKFMQNKIAEDIRTHLIPRLLKRYELKNNNKVHKLFDGDYRLLVNPTGKFVIGGPHGDTGLTGRKIIVDTYGGRGAHGGGAFSGKDPSKVDRSAAYAMRHIAKNLVAAGVADEVLVQVAYAIGVAQPVGLYIDTNGTAKVKDASGQIMKDGDIALKVKELIDLRPYAIVQSMGLKNPIFLETAKYGHFGREHYTKEIEVFYGPEKDASVISKEKNGSIRYYKTVDFFAWEKLDLVNTFKAAFKI